PETEPPAADDSPRRASREGGWKGDTVGDTGRGGGAQPAGPVNHPAAPPSESNRPGRSSWSPVSACQPSSSCTTSTASATQPPAPRSSALFQLSPWPAGCGFRKAIWSDVCSCVQCSVPP